MRTIEILWLGAACASSGIAGCAPSLFDPPDGGIYVFDGAMIPGTDAGARDAPLDGRSVDVGPRDGGLPRDTPPIPSDAPVCRDAGSPGGDCVLRVPVGTFGPLNAVCLPRCSAATATTYRACTSNSCRTAAAEADRTPGADYFIGGVHVTTPLDCGACVAYQEMHCFSEVCESQVDAYVDQCIAGGTPSSCDAALSDLDFCLAVLSPAEEDVVTACMASQDGPEGCFPCGG
jgi:hypothetical protein